MSSPDPVKSDSNRRYYEKYRERVLAERKASRNSAEYLERVRQYRSSPEQKLKTIARNKVFLALRSGQMVKPDICGDCKETFPLKAIQGHHTDYSRPTDPQFERISA